MNDSDPRAQLAAQAIETIEGATEAQRLVSAIRAGIASPGALLKLAREAFSLQSEAFAAGFARELEKSLERAGS